MADLNVCIGSLNPTKINAVKRGFSKFFENYTLFEISADSQVSNQPIGIEEIIEGAKNRAQQALTFLKEKGLENCLGVGIESGLAEVSQAEAKYMDFQFCVIKDESGCITIGSGNAFEHPKFVIEEIFSKDGAEIGVIMGQIANNPNLKNESGAISVLSKNVITRTDILSHAVICALLPRINKSLYEKPA